MLIANWKLLTIPVNFDRHSLYCYCQFPFGPSNRCEPVSSSQLVRPVGMGLTPRRLLSESTHSCGKGVLRNCCTGLTWLPRVFPCYRTVAAQRRGATAHDLCDGAKAISRVYALLIARCPPLARVRCVRHGTIPHMAHKHTRPQRDCAEHGIHIHC